MVDYEDGLLHGECVAIGMVLESNLARALGILPSPAVGTPLPRPPTCSPTPKGRLGSLSVV